LWQERRGLLLLLLLLKRRPAQQVSLWQVLLLLLLCSRCTLIPAYPRSTVGPGSLAAHQVHIGISTHSSKCWHAVSPAGCIAHRLHLTDDLPPTLHRLYAPGDDLEGRARSCVLRPTLLHESYVAPETYGGSKFRGIWYVNL
jgi:hypothetical protein